MANKTPTPTQETPLDVFVHIPKTGGTAINHMLTRSGLLGQDHFQNWMNQPIKAKDMLSSLKWISGHISLINFQSFLIQNTSRRTRFFSAIRSPLSQITSHYNWIIEIYHRSPFFYDDHPESIKEISERIRRTDNSKPEAVIKQLEMAAPLFLNNQSTFLIGEDAKNLPDNKIIDRIREYDLIVTEHYIPLLITRMTGISIPKISHKNKSNYHFDPAVFRSPQVIDFLKENNRADITIYDSIMSNGGYFSLNSP